MTKVIVFGYTGMIGNYIYQLLKAKRIEVIGLASKEFDIRDCTYELIEEVICTVEPDYVINCAGIIPHNSHKYNATDNDYYKVNSIFPQLVNRICFYHNIRFIHITTDCIYDGIINSVHDKITNSLGRYGEEDDPTEKETYGLSKSLGDNLGECCIIRTSVIGEEKHNKNSLLEWVLKQDNLKKDVNGYANHYWNGITGYELAKIIYNIIEKDKYWIGIKHIFSPTIVSKYELLCLIKKVYHLNININKINAINNIDKTLTTNYGFIIKVPDLEEQINELFSINLL